MKNRLALLMLGAATLIAAPLFAQAPAKTTTPAPAADRRCTGGRARRCTFCSACQAAEGAEKSAAQNAQQQRMKDCNAKAGDKKGDERKSFMSACLSGKEPPAKMTQQEKMKDCNVKAGDKKGDERKAFMSSCLKG